MRLQVMQDLTQHTERCQNSWVHVALSLAAGSADHPTSMPKLDAAAAATPLPPRNMQVCLPGGCPLAAEL